MVSKHGALVVVGSGPGVGRHVAAKFAEQGFEKVVVMSRNADRLSEDADMIRSVAADVKVLAITVDLSNSDHVEQSLKKVDESLEGTPLECVIFNAARTAKSIFFEFEPAELQSDLQITIVGLYSVARWAVPQLSRTANLDEAKTPSLIVTSGMLAKDPFPAMFSLAASKAGQYSLVHSLHKEFEPKGVHCMAVIIAGTVAPKSERTNPANIANEIWTEFSRPRGQGKLEHIIEDPAYAEHVKNREK